MVKQDRKCYNVVISKPRQKNNCQNRLHFLPNLPPVSLLWPLGPPGTGQWLCAADRQICWCTRMSRVWQTWWLVTACLFSFHLAAASPQTLHTRTRNTHTFVNAHGCCQLSINFVFTLSKVELCRIIQTKPTWWALQILEYRQHYFLSLLSFSLHCYVDWMNTAWHYDLSLWCILCILCKSTSSC